VGTADTIGLVVAIVAALLMIVATAAVTAATASSRLRVRLLVQEGLPRAQALETFTEERNAVLSSLTLFRNVTLIVALCAGLYLYLKEVGDSWGQVAIFGLLAVVVVTVLQSPPRLIVSRNPEQWSLRLSPLIGGVRLLFGPPAAILDIPGRALARVFAEAPERDLDEVEELVRLLEMEKGSGAIDEEEREMIRGVIGLVDTTAREIMVPRIDISAVTADASLEEAVAVIVEKGYSRLPIYEESVDNIVGAVYAKDLLPYMLRGDRPKSLAELARPPYFIPEGKKVDELLTELRRSQIHIAIVVDEYGGTAGLVTIEDLLEEIVGEIEDEYDVAATPIEKVGDDEAIVDARVSIDALNELFHVKIEDEDFDTVGGLIYHTLGKMPGPGDNLSVDGLDFQVVSVMGRRIKKVRVARHASPEAAAADAK
jgi:magnesium and cobalt exporter, CNNM family